MPLPSHTRSYPEPTTRHRPDPASYINCVKYLADTDTFLPMSRPDPDAGEISVVYSALRGQQLPTICSMCLLSFRCPVLNTASKFDRIVKILSAIKNRSRNPGLEVVQNLHDGVLTAAGVDGGMVFVEQRLHREVFLMNSQP